MDSDTAFSVISVPFDYADAIIEIRSSHTQPIEFRAVNRQTKKSVRSYELYILLILAILFLAFKIKYQRFSILFIKSGESLILRYIMLQDGKK